MESSLNIDIKRLLEGMPTVDLREALKNSGRNFNIDTYDYRGRYATLMEQAYDNVDYERVKILLEHGADPDLATYPYGRKVDTRESQSLKFLSAPKRDRERIDELFRRYRDKKKLEGLLTLVSVLRTRSPPGLDRRMYDENILLNTVRKFVARSPEK